MGNALRSVDLTIALCQLLLNLFHVGIIFGGPIEISLGGRPPQELENNFWRFREILYNLV